MICLVMGTVAFLFFLLYDWNQCHENRAWLRPFFALGCLLLCGATLALAFPLRGVVSTPWGAGRGAAAVVAAAALLLLLYTLFFALPFQKTYIAQDAHKVYKQGMYALCRHPGVLWFALFYVCYAIALGKPTALWAALLFSLWNILYVVLQDRFFFPRLFDDYEQYRESTPFLIPNSGSIRKCAKFFFKSNRKEGEPK